MPDRIKGRIIDAATNVDIRRSERQAVAWCEERRHLEGGREIPVQDGEVDEIDRCGDCKSALRARQRKDRIKGL